MLAFILADLSLILLPTCHFPLIYYYQDRCTFYGILIGSFLLINGLINSCAVKYI